MASRSTRGDSLISSRPPEQPLSVQLHPLVLLVISDYITRYTLRGLQGPLFGAIIGQQIGRSYTLEHAYECTTTVDGDGDYLFDADFFTQRLEQYKAVHKAPALDLVAVFMLGSLEGPQSSQIPAILQAQKLAGNENILLVLFHPGMVDTLEGGKLPISIYEAFKEQDGKIQFWERPFEVETGEAEMIGINYVAKGGGKTQTASHQSDATYEEGPKTRKAKSRGKAKEEADSETTTVATNELSTQDDELLAALTAKVNAVKMLKQRLELIRSYLSSLPASTLTDASSTDSPGAVNLALLRNIHAMISRLPLLIPESSQAATNPANLPSSFAQASATEEDDVQLSSLLASLTRTIADAQNLGLRFSVVQRERLSKERGGAGRLGPVLNDNRLDTGGP